MSRAFTLLLRGILLRCPVCGEGHLFQRPFKMHERCPVCNFYFEREEGYFSSSMAINLILSELIIAGFTVPLAANLNTDLVQLFLWGAPVPFLLPLLFFHHSRGLWMSMDHYLHPVQRTPVS